MATKSAKSQIAAQVDLSRLLNPASIAVIGASSNPKTISGQPLRLMLDHGYRGKIYPVNLKRTEVQGLRAYPDVLSVPRPCDVALIAVSASQVPSAIEQCGVAGIPFAVVLAGGFEEIGEQGCELQQQLDAAIAKSGVRVVGPNCVGVVNFAARAYCAFGFAMWDPSLQPGPVAVVSQSGGIAIAIMAHLYAQHGVGSNYLVSCGNETDLDFFDFVHQLLGQDDVKIVAVYLEASTEGTRLRELGRRALKLGKPILTLKVGNTGAGRRAASSHTGRLTADYNLFRAAFREGGFIEVNDLDELADVATLVLGGKFPKGRNIGVITGSGGWGVMMAEHCERNGLQLPLPSAATMDKLAEWVPSYGSRGNPIDMTPVYDQQYKVMQCLIDDPGIDQLLVRSAQGPDIEIWARRFIETASKTDKPVIVAWVQIPSRNPEVREMIEKSGFLCASYAGRAARAASVFTEFALKRQKFQQHGAIAPARSIPRQILNLGVSVGPLSEHASKQCLAQYGIPVTKEVLLNLDQIASLTECPIAFPVAVKLASPDIPHKTEANAVQLGIRTLDELKRAAESVTTAGLRHSPSARIDGISVQEMVSGVEMIVGAASDPHFGPYVMLGLGGVLTEVLHDVTHRFAPITVADAHEMVGELKSAKILKGYRGSPPGDVDCLIEMLVKLSWLISDHASRIAEVDINPLFVRTKGYGVVAADALIVTSRPA